MFVMDYSGSMKTNDSQDIARGMVKAFVDTVHSADIRVGFVAYNDRILTSTSPLTIQTEEERAKLKELIDQEQYPYHPIFFHFPALPIHTLFFVFLRSLRLMHSKLRSSTICSLRNTIRHFC